MRELYKEMLLSEFSKEDLIVIIEAYQHFKFMIGEDFGI